MRDRLFFKAFSRVHVYNILFEDAEVDERFLGLDEESTVLGITGAGCGIAGMMSKNPRRIDAVDINHHHLALTALKCNAPRKMSNYADFYDLFARGYSATSEQTVRKLSEDMPTWLRAYWKLHNRRFNTPFHSQGLCGQVFTALRKRVKLNADWLRSTIPMDYEERCALINEYITPVLYRPGVKAMINSPLQLFSMGINYEQRDRMLETAGADMLGFFVQQMEAIAGTHIPTNWFAWYIVAGQYNHEHPDAVPPYLRRDRYEAAAESTTSMRFHHGNLFDVLERAGPNTWSHYTLCDATDWMPPPVQRKLLEEIRRTARPGAVVLHRSVEKEGFVEQLGMDNTFQLMDCSDEATEADRSRQYNRVNFYRVAA